MLWDRDSDSDAGEMENGSDKETGNHLSCFFVL